MDATKSISKSLGGDRLGSGNKMNVQLHKYNRSNHDLSFAWRSSANVGTLIPCLKKVALPGDTFSIDIESIVRTMPAVAPLYGSYKMQIDVFECPIRLYNGLLHNNMTKIGLNMEQVLLPKIWLSHNWRNPNKWSYDINDSQIATDSLLGYLGIKGIGDTNEQTNSTVNITRGFNAVPILAYWDIYKNYYANKQEEKGRFLGVALSQQIGTIVRLQGSPMPTISHKEYDLEILSPYDSTIPGGVTITQPQYGEVVGYTKLQQLYWNMLTNGAVEIDPTNMEVVLELNGAYSTQSLATVFPNWIYNGNNNIQLGYNNAAYNNYNLVGIGYTSASKQDAKTQIIEFPLENIDKARIEILRATGLNQTISWATLSTPYINLEVQDADGNNINKYHQYGLGLKTYQSDVLNNWLKTEWIDGVGGINEITAVDTSSGSFTMDALNLAKKVYNMLNRIAVSGGSYEDYIEAVYSTEVTRRAESPIYCGGASFEIVFEEVVSQSATADDPLGTLAGKGNITNKKGGHVEIHVEEPSYIMAIMSITPRLDYSQGNDWDMTEIDTLADLHKPELDGIGFQDLLQERAAWWGTYFDVNDNNKLVKLAMGKSPAWIDYMTSVNETHGDFAQPNKAMFMTLNRQYEYDYDQNNKKVGIKDVTTYVNPSKYNYVFAESDLDAQNFWIQIGWRIETRRVMSAKIIPTM